MKRPFSFHLLIIALLPIILLGSTAVGHQAAIVYTPIMPLRSTAVGPQTTVTYTPSSASLTNPERGFYHYQETRGSSFSPYDLATLQGYRTDEQITLLYCIHYLDTFVTTPLGQPFLQHIQDNLNTVRTAGLKCILRFAYTDTLPNGENPPYGDANKTQILAHLAQLQPILWANADVIAVVQAGFIGVWGEWYYTDHFGNLGNISPSDYANRLAVVNRLLGALPTSRMIQLRTPNYKKQLFNNAPALSASSGHSQSAVARTGHHNDCFLASSTDFGTYLDDTQSEYPYLAADTAYAPMGGESCWPNPPRSNCPTALQEMALFHWSYVNSEYHPDVLAGWNSGGCLSAMERQLGYRLALLQGQYSDTAAPGGELLVTLSLHNEGFAAPFNPRLVQILLRHTTSGAIYAATLPDDPRFWLASSTAVYSLSHSLCLPSDLPSGSYALLLNLPDPAPALRSRVEYAILLANEGNVRETSTGYNRLNHTVTVNPAALPTSCSGTITFTPWQATAVAPSLSSSSSLGLSWTTAAANCTYTLHRAADPYFAPTAQTILDDTLVASDSSYNASADLGNLSSHSFYRVEGINCAGTATAVSNTIGAFSFALQPGT